MDEKRKLQFDILDKTDTAMYRWAKSERINIYNIEIVVPFVDTHFDVEVVIFYETNQNYSDYMDSITEQVKQKYLELLKDNNYPDDWLKQVSIEFDTHEEVIKNFNGSYFARMR